MEIALLIGVIVFLVWMFIEGYRKGFIRIVLSLAVTVIALVLSIAFSGPATNFIKNDTPLYDKINKEMKEYVGEYVSKEVDASGQEIQEDSIKKLKLPSSIQDKLIENNTADEKLSMGVDNFSDYLANSLTDILVEALAIFILFIVIKLALRIVVSLLDIISRLPIIHGVNKYLGGLIGIVEAVLILWMVCIALTAISGTSAGEQIFSAISSNSFLNFIYNNNLLTHILL